MFNYPVTVRLRETDAFGIIYFTEQLNYCNEALQEFLSTHNVPLPADLSQAPFGLPIVHCESDFLHPLRLNDTILVHIDTFTCGTTSIHITYSLYKNDTLVGTAHITHVCIDTATGKPIDVPNSLKDISTKKNATPSSTLESPE